MPGAKHINAKNNQFLEKTRSNAGKARVRAADLVETDENGEPVRRRRAGLEKGRGIVKPPVSERVSKKPAVSSTTLYLICFVVIGGVFFELLRLFL
ncbi:uncharacterized protein PFL1_03025 [Pseudozyma flocculosa PF-1]|uniref:Stress-associated endoplasmic reticulum protein n=2 Tax=Pseudozyma flocculosa TaxID=84751 RepID=A0A5C3F183_9BASI|nr:uncharacterized protein PFL1_03025 [Pseudozyma flocculosa PF-1]EPQ29270.1 hypothetical protein PFL1_03025 [Pseudozyma flocculosa PF-1]SPO37775.1 uncharacterized protein PSFLO_03251 [Pseudozyma flocculosa]